MRFDNSSKVRGRLGVERRYWLIAERGGIPMVLTDWAAKARAVALRYPGVCMIDMMRTSQCIGTHLLRLRTQCSTVLKTEMRVVVIVVYTWVRGQREVVHDVGRMLLRRIRRCSRISHSVVRGGNGTLMPLSAVLLYGRFGLKVGCRMSQHSFLVAKLSSHVLVASISMRLLGNRLMRRVRVVKERVHPSLYTVYKILNGVQLGRVSTHMKSWIVALLGSGLYGVGQSLRFTCARRMLEGLGSQCIYVASGSVELRSLAALAGFKLQIMTLIFCFSFNRRLLGLVR